MVAEAENPFAGRELAGGHLALDFANTLSEHVPEERGDWLGSYDDLAWWGAFAGALKEDEVGALLRASAARPDEAEAVLARARRLRAAIFAVFDAAGQERTPPTQALATLNAELAVAASHLCLACAGPGPAAWGWSGDGLDRVLWPVARAAGELLTSPEVTRVGQCASETCQWIYLDTSRNHSRRWCVMSDCGNRAKAKRHYQRSRETAGD